VHSKRSIEGVIRVPIVPGRRNATYKTVVSFKRKDGRQKKATFLTNSLPTPIWGGLQIRKEMGFRKGKEIRGDLTYSTLQRCTSEGKWPKGNLSGDEKFQLSKKFGWTNQERQKSQTFVNQVCESPREVSRARPLKLSLKKNQTMGRTAGGKEPRGKKKGKSSFEPKVKAKSPGPQKGTLPAQKKQPVYWTPIREGKKTPG